MILITAISDRRSMTLFKESIKSKYTKMNYTSHLNQFKEFTGVSCEDQWLIIPQKDLQIMLENYIMHLRHTASPNSIPSKFRGIKHFFIMNRVDLNWNIIHKMFPQKQKPPSLRAYTTNEIMAMLSHTTSFRDRALIHFLASTGARIGVFDHTLSIKHMRNMPRGCMATLLYAGDIEEYWTFLTPQAAKAINAYHGLRKHNGEVFGLNTPIFATSKFAPKQLGWSGARSVVYRTIRRSDLTRHKQDGRYDVQADHGFRKRFNTILKLNNSVNHNVAEKLMGHKNGLDGVYLTPTVNELFAEFRKVMHKMEI